MKGTLLDFSIQYNEGIINGEDNKRYSFIGAEWKEQVAPVRGQQVDFLVNELGQAVGVYLATLGTPFQQPAAFQESNAQLQEEQNYGFFDWAMKCLKNYTNFSGRARRKEYWYFYLFQILLGFILGLILEIIGLSESQVNIFTGLLNLFFFLPALAVGVRRLHDVDRSGWWMLIAFTIIGLIPLFIWMVSETKPERNQWGNPAK
ncbi:DUF805 domain-containing protein [Acinetobacter brisouii]|uniref:DUF805 domain-containing protein n=1 Tax=Acinetobacter brisouii TaxID=396323 RepID=UPI0005F7C1C9|nr:DUF805 domain-containing protein [Acinetobacter brisouii]KJV38571.1 hypothetical protein VH98_09070 [Acinetobacter brisouii]